MLVRVRGTSTRYTMNVWYDLGARLHVLPKQKNSAWKRRKTRTSTRGVVHTFPHKSARLDSCASFVLTRIPSPSRRASAPVHFCQNIESPHPALRAALVQERFRAGRARGQKRNRAQAFCHFPWNSRRVPYIFYCFSRQARHRRGELNIVRTRRRRQCPTPRRRHNQRRRRRRRYTTALGRSRRRAPAHPSATPKVRETKVPVFFRFYSFSKMQMPPARTVFVLF